MALWYGCAIANLFLCLLLLYRGHSIRYRVLFASLIYEVFAFSLLIYVYHHYGTASNQYAMLYEGKKLGSIAFAFGIIFEAWRWRNPCVRVPQEIYLLLLLAFFLLQKAQYLHIAHVVHEALRYACITIILWWTYCFRKESPYERRRFQEPR